MVYRSLYGMYMCGMRERRKYRCSRKYSRLRTDGGFPGGKLLRGEEKVTFYMWASDAEQEFDKAIVAQYEKENPDIDIEENYIPYAEYLSKINTMAAAGSMPDIFNLPEGNVFEWGAKGALLDLKPLYEAAGVNPSDVSVDSAIFPRMKMYGRWAIT